MGQYYAPVIIDSARNPTVLWWFDAHAYDNGLKLMEHSYVGNNFVRAVETFLAGDAAARLVWAGDYADPEPGGHNLWQLCGNGRAVYVTAAMEGEEFPPGREATPDERGFVLDVPLIDDAACRYLINVDDHLYVDTAAAPLARPGEWDARIHPLPLLTAEGNGRGGGDYRSDAPLIGSWARRRIAVSGQVPLGYAELDFAAGLLPEGVYRDAAA